jgi:heavy metal translocating P-type ATPase
VHAILEESGILASGQDIRETDLFRESLRLGLISNRADAATAALPAAETCELLFQIEGMWCNSCAWLIEHALMRERGILSAEVFFVSDLLKVKYCPQYLPAERIVKRVASLGYRAREYSGEDETESTSRRDLLLRAGVAGFLWLNVMTLSAVLYVGFLEKIADSVARFLPFVLFALTTPVIFYSGRPILRLGLGGLRHAVIRMETLLAVGILAAYGASGAAALTGGRHFYFDTACAIVTLVLAGKLAERSAKEKAHRAVATLYRLMPKKARVVTGGRERFVAVEALEPGTIFLVQSGERIPADGVVAEGRSHVDESVLTGESVPQSRGPGDNVICGSMNERNPLQIRATNTGAASTLAQIIRAVETALATRSGLERQADRVSRIFVPAVILLAIATFAASGGLMRALSVLIIACPCALGIATPLAISSAIATAARRHVLIQDSRALEMVARIDAVVLDKTGTVTEGRFEVREIAGDRTLLPAVIALEKTSPHPIAKALVRWADDRSAVSAHSVEVQPGAGITGVVDGRRILAGQSRLFPNPPEAELAAQVTAWERQGYSAIYFGTEEGPAGAIALGDRVKPEAHTLVDALKAQGMRTLLVSGDARDTTEFIGSQLGIDEVISEALPGQKVEIIRRLQEQGKTVAMLGDGVNDAPSLAQADLGIALGSGTDIAMKAAPLVVTSGRLEPVLEAFAVSARTLRVIRQNLFWAFLYNSAGIALAMTGRLHPVFAAAAMVLSSVSVVWNASRSGR